jgi:hypothetical protein
MNMNMNMNNITNIIITKMIILFSEIHYNICYY